MDGHNFLCFNFYYEIYAAQIVAIAECRLFGVAATKQATPTTAYSTSLIFLFFLLACAKQNGNRIPCTTWITNNNVKCATSVFIMQLLQINAFCFSSIRLLRYWCCHIHPYPIRYYVVLVGQWKWWIKVDERHHNMLNLLQFHFARTIFYKLVRRKRVLAATDSIRFRWDGFYFHLACVNKYIHTYIIK